MQYTGVLKKMQTKLDNPIRYFLELEGNNILINDLLNQKIQISFIGSQCLCCNKPKKIFRQGFCYDCFYESPMVGDWIMRPELSTAHLGIEDRDLEYEKEVQLKPHIVYLALSSDVKVGVTRNTQVPTRWIDQGANAALKIMEAPNRYLAGITEVALKQYLADKTNWRRMLKNEISEKSLTNIRDSVIQYIPDEASEFILEKESILELNFPVQQYPDKIKSLNLTKTPTHTGTLVGIKGQYLIFEDSTVFNVRSNEGTIVTLTVN